MSSLHSDVTKGGIMQGLIIRWNDERGFGFISSKECNGDVFAHISQFKKGYRRPKVGDLVIFQVALEKGKQSAKSILLVGVQPESTGMNTLSSRLVGGLVLIGIVFGIYSFLMEPRSPPVIQPTIKPEVQLAIQPAYEKMGFSCKGKTHCSQMISCDEAKYYLAHCPNVEIDGDADNVPCERQHCNRF
jgi:cold shock CspA family protein